MKTVTEHIREHLLSQKGIPPIEPAVDLTKISLDDLRKSEWSRKFETLMRNRLVMGAVRYGRMNTAKPKYDKIPSIIERVKKYQKGGNLEHLVDVANLALLEFEEGSHPLKHFSSIDNHNFHTKVVK